MSHLSLHCPNSRFVRGEGHPLYPVDVRIEVAPGSSRFWAIPVLGILVKAIILIPHIIIVYVLGIVIAVLQLVLWIPVLFGGQYPTWGYDLVGGYLRWSVRLAAFFYGLTDQYPPFDMGNS